MFASALQVRTISRVAHGLGYRQSAVCIFSTINAMLFIDRSMSSILINLSNDK
jgi:hypothetical protein